jgi:ribose/xylose/arabinose/galactoside ABC-type transport system permease subunit
MNANKAKKVVSLYLSWFIVIAEFLIFMSLSSAFVSFRNIMTVFRQVSITAVMATGMCYVMLSGYMDLSVGSIVSISGVVVAKCYSEAGFSILACVAIGLLTGVLIGFVNGAIITKTKMPSIIGTIGMQQAVAGIALLITNGAPIYAMGERWKWISQGYLFNQANGIPNTIIYVLIVLLITIFILTRTYFGRHIYACGSNEEAARLCGIDTNQIHIVTYMISGFMSAVAGIMLMSRVNSGQPTGGQGMEMDVLTALVVGGISFSGGQGKIINVLSGSLVIGVLSNGLVNIGVSEFWQKLIKGMVLLFAVGIDAIQQRKKNTI